MGSDVSSSAPVLEATPTPSAVFGDGPFPADLRRFNWGAFLLPGLWSLVHGRWIWCLIRVALVLGWLAVLTPLRTSVGVSLSDSRLLLVLAPFELATHSVALWFGARANERIWADAGKRIARGIKIGTVSEVMKVQRNWMIGAVVWTLLGVFGTTYLLISKDTSRVVGGSLGLMMGSVLEWSAIAVAAVLASRLDRQRLAVVEA